MEWDTKQNIWQTEVLISHNYDHLMAKNHEVHYHIQD